MDPMTNTPTPTDARVAHDAIAQPQPRTDLDGLALQVCATESGTIEDTDDDTILARLGGLLIKIGAKHVEHYHSDFVRDAQWLARRILPGIRSATGPKPGDGLWRIFYSVNDCGTLIGFDRNFAHQRPTAQFVITLAVEQRGYGSILSVVVQEVVK